MVVPFCERLSVVQMRDSTDQRIDDGTRIPEATLNFCETGEFLSGFLSKPTALALAGSVRTTDRQIVNERDEREGGGDAGDQQPATVLIERAGQRRAECAAYKAAGPIHLAHTGSARAPQPGRRSRRSHRPARGWRWRFARARSAGSTRRGSRSRRE